MKFLVLWHFDLTRLAPEVARAVMQMPDYAKKLGDKLECRYHVIGSHGGAWIYKVTSNEELDRLLAMSPVYNYATTKFWRWQRWKTLRRSRERRASQQRGSGR
jgi:hypothetical protein